MVSTDEILAQIEANRDRYLDELVEYLKIPSISTDPEYAPEVERCSRYLRDRFVEAGLQSELIETAGHPIVYAERLVGEDRPTVLFYGHYDVQPVDPIEEWRHPPFEPTLEGERLVARGATDDKGQSYTHLKAVEAILASRGELPVNVKFVIEGEEESGGEAIERFVTEDAGERLACDCVVISDSSMIGPGQPALVYGLRGMVYFEITVEGPNRDLHSGSYGGAVRNPVSALAGILDALLDPESGRILVPGIYDRVRDLEEWEREEIAAVPLDEAEMLEDLAVPALHGEEGYSAFERIGVRPSLDVNGIWGGYQGRGAKTVLPARAGAKVSIRLVPEQEPWEVEQAVHAYVEGLSPSGVRTSVRTVHGGRPVRLDLEGPFSEAAAAALEETFGNRPIRVREGGSIPIVATFDEVLDIPVLLMGFGLPDDRLHSPNEKIDLPQFYRGIECTVRLLERIGAIEGPVAG